MSLKKAGRPTADCEFLVLQLENDGARLSHVTDSGVRNCVRAYIGDSNQYSELTKLRKPYTPAPTHYVQQSDGSFRIERQEEQAGVSEFMEISDAMRDLSQKRSGSVGAIGDCIVRVCKAGISQKLEYLQLHEASVSPWEGSSGYSLLVSNSAPRGIGVYYSSGKLGFIMIVGDTEHLRKGYSDTKEGFVQLAKAKYGLELA